MIFRSNKDRDAIRAIFAAAPTETDARFKRELQEMAAAYIPVLFDSAVMIFGDPIAHAIQKMHGEGTSECMARLLLLTDPFLLPPRPAAKIAPYSAANALDARVAKLEFDLAERKREQKARDLHRKLWNSVAPFEGVNVYYDEDFGIPNVPPELDDFIFTGLTRATVGNWRNPCPRGLKELESLLKLPVGTNQMRRFAKFYKERKAVAWNLFEEFEGKRLATLDRDRRKQVIAAIRIAEINRNVYPGQARDVFDDQRNRPDGVTLEQFGALKTAYVGLIDDWFNETQPAKLSEFG